MLFTQFDFKIETKKKVVSLSHTHTHVTLSIHHILVCVRIFIAKEREIETQSQENGAVNTVCILTIFIKINGCITAILHAFHLFDTNKKTIKITIMKNETIIKQNRKNERHFGDNELAYCMQ